MCMCDVWPSWIELGMHIYIYKEFRSNRHSWENGRKYI